MTDVADAGVALSVETSDVGCRPALTATAWAVTLVAVGLPGVALSAADMTVPPWLPVAGVVAVAAGVLGSLLFAILRPLLGYWIVLLIALPAVNISLWPGAVRDLAIQLPAGSAALGGELLRELLLCGLAILALFAFGYSRRDAFLRAGDLAAPARPSEW